MRLKVISCQVLTREMQQVISTSPHTIEVEFLTMGLHDLGVVMRPRLQERIDASDSDGYDSILLGYALCGRGTEGLRAGKTRLLLPRAHDCIALLMGERHRYQAYFDSHSGVYYRSPGWLEFQTPGQILEQAGATAGRVLGERQSHEEFVAKYGDENGFIFSNSSMLFAATILNSHTFLLESKGRIFFETRRAPKRRKKGGDLMRFRDRSRC